MVMFFMNGPGYWILIFLALTGCLMVLSYWGYFIYKKVTDYLLENVSQKKGEEE